MTLIKTINPNSKLLMATKMAVGFTVAFGAGVLATAVIRHFTPADMKRITKLGVFVAGYSIAWAAGDAAGNIAQTQINDGVDIANSAIDTINNIRMKQFATEEAKVV